MSFGLLRFRRFRSRRPPVPTSTPAWGIEHVGPLTERDIVEVRQLVDDAIRAIGSEGTDASRQRRSAGPGQGGS